ncbi:GntR family transcriptional regulator [Micromonospora sp. ATCC 39149]|uniref:GntR family transcriptional regulator n=1 Tax=Micromonospora carbonacea TaxID=47853 RepID=A0A7D5YJ86_9ACTN|nr:GntR family transcriptional regulator [Micromonospora sp. ATCC 39149]EEP73087.1 GntR family transcriptional regulator [Micromonospora sp. ATCC 39149]QLJ99134.1 GntR family transcriptional regulator [Micromonospora carbonacea]
MPIEVAPPKYVVIVNAVQQRIEDGTYPLGGMLPSETELIREFRASRPVVVRALDLLRQGGWIESRQGKGRFVLGRPGGTEQRSRERRYGLLDDDERAGSTLLAAGTVPAPPRAAVALGVEPGTPVVARRRLITVEEVGPVELGTAFLSVELAEGTGVGAEDAMPEGLLRHVASRKRLKFDHVTERISARLPSAEEAELLQVRENDPVLTVLLVICDRSATPLLAVDVLLPASRHDLEDVYPLD